MFSWMKGVILLFWMMSVMHKLKNEKKKKAQKKKTLHIWLVTYTRLYDEISSLQKIKRWLREMKWNVFWTWVLGGLHHARRPGFVLGGFGSEASHRRKLAGACWWQSVRRLKWLFFCLLSTRFHLNLCWRTAERRKRRSGNVWHNITVW